MNDGDVDGEAAVKTPVLNGDVSRSTTGLVSRTQDTQLLQLNSGERRPKSANLNT